MLRNGFAWMLGLVIGCASSVTFGKEVQYVGVQKCKKCHVKNGDQYGKWKNSKHSKAYEVLASDKAKEIGKKLGVADPQQSEKCLKCHTTGYGEKPEKFAASFDIKDGVQCESCHGAGSAYKKSKIMKDRDKSIAAGLILPTEEVCVKCHNKDAPGFEGFDFKKMHKKIAHPRVEKKK